MTRAALLVLALLALHCDKRPDETARPAPASYEAPRPTGPTYRPSNWNECVVREVAIDRADEGDSLAGAPTSATPIEGWTPLGPIATPGGRPGVLLCR